MLWTWLLGCLSYFNLAATCARRGDAVGRCLLEGLLVAGAVLGNGEVLGDIVKHFHVHLNADATGL